MITINEDLTSHIVSDDGTLECFLASHNPETLAPFTSREDVEAFIPKIYENANYWQPYKSPEEREQLEAERTSKGNASRAKSELLASDWVENASVRDTNVTPHLTNAADFDAYRLVLRFIAVNKPATVETWPVLPDAIWSE